MRVLSYDVPECDDGRQVKYVMRSRLGISHRQLSRLKTTDGMSERKRRIGSRKPCRAYRRQNQSAP